MSDEMVKVEKMNSFVPAAFESGDLELRCDESAVVIYGTPHGLARLAESCMKLAQLPGVKSEHYHLEDYKLLTSKSLRATVAVFPNPGDRVT